MLKIWNQVEVGVFQNCVNSNLIERFKTHAPDFKIKKTVWNPILKVSLDNILLK